MKKSSGVNWSKKAPSVSRRLRVINMLTAQLKAGNKHNDGVITNLTEKDVIRITKELETLKTRV